MDLDRRRPFTPREDGQLFPPPPRDLAVPALVLEGATHRDPGAVRQASTAVTPWIIRKAEFLACGSFRPSDGLEATIVAAARKIGSLEARRDAAREAAVRVIRLLVGDGGPATTTLWSRVDPSRPLAPFLGKVVKNVVSKVLEREARLGDLYDERDGAQAAAAAPAPHRDPERTLVDRTTLLRVLAEIALMPARQREAIERVIRREVDGEAGGAREPDAVQKARYHARRRLAAMLDDRARRL